MLGTLVRVTGVRDGYMRVLHAASGVPYHLVTDTASFPSAARTVLLQGTS